MPGSWAVIWAVSLWSQLSLAATSYQGLYIPDLAVENRSSRSVLYWSVHPLIIAAILTLPPWSTGKPITKSQTLTLILRVGGMEGAGRARYTIRGRQREEQGKGKGGATIGKRDTHNSDNEV